MIRKVPRVPSIDHNLIPPFTMRAGGVAINEVPKILSEDPEVNDHGVYFEHSNMQITLQFNGFYASFALEYLLKEKFTNVIIFISLLIRVVRTMTSNPMI